MKYDAVVVGAGFAGMYMLYRLREMGLSVQVFESGSGVGGTWFWNRYPGARCDVQSLDYSYSFSEELQQEWEWSERYATQPEILGYANHVADRFNLKEHIAFDTKIISANYQDSSKKWLVTTEKGETHTSQFCILATGCLSVPKAIDIEGIENFAGESYYTSSWPREEPHFGGKRVAVIGTGSSAIQTIPVVAEQASSLTVYQRTAAFSQPAKNRTLDREEVRVFKENYQKHREASKHSLFGVPDKPMAQSALEVDEKTRNKVYEDAWREGTLISLYQSFNDLLFDKEANDTAAEFVHRKIREVVKDPATADALCPDEFPIATKRACLDSGYYQCFNQPHVSLVDLKKNPVERVTEKGIKTTDQEREFDAIIYATGFDAMTGAILGVEIKGSNEISLREKWFAGPKSYLGLGVSGFPNLFLITGPGSPSVMSNMIVSIEQHVDWIADCIKHMQTEGLSTIEPDSTAEQEWVDHVNDVANATLFPSANSWYMGANIPGKPRVFMPYIGGCGVYREKCDSVAAKNYEGFVLNR